MASPCQLQCRQGVGTLLLLIMFTVSQCAHVRPHLMPLNAHEKLKQQQQLLPADRELSESGGSWSRALKFLVPTPALILPYHNGPLLSAPARLPVYIIWYGAFSELQKSIVRDFFVSFSASAQNPSVASWWKLTAGYKDSAGSSVSSKISLEGELEVKSDTIGKSLSEANIQTLVLDSLNATFPSNSNGVYLVLTAGDVAVEDFCMNSCASHFATPPETVPGGKQLPYAWVANSGRSAQCAGRCAWPYAKAEYGPPGEPLVAPNGNVGMDGMLINIGIILAGMATDPFTNGFYQGDASAPLEAASACAGIYGPGAYSGYPGQLLVDSTTGASYNVNGFNGRKYLMPALWDPVTLACTPPA